ncbi:MAG TPA: cobalamin-dependent protein [Burkholderiales bacterium]
MQPLASHRLNERRHDIAAATVARLLDLYPHLAARTEGDGLQRYVDQTVFHAAHLSQAIAFDAPQLFVEYACWARAVWSSTGIPEAHLTANLEALASVLADFVPPAEAHAGAAIIEEALRAYEDPDVARIHPLYCSRDSRPGISYIDDTQPLGALARRVVEALLALRRNEAAALLHQAAAAGVSVPDLYVRVLQPALYEIGLLWQTNQISVALEHYGCAVVQMLIDQLQVRLPQPAGTRGRVVVACVPGEVHECGARMVAYLLQAAGWDTLYLGANVPADAVVEIVERADAHVLCLSVSGAMHLYQAASLIAELRARRGRGILVLLGGGVLNRVPELWRRLGGDAYAADALGAVEVLAAARRADGAAREPG